MALTKKGMGVGQVFLFIIAAITFALITIFGYQAITKFISQGENVEFVQFKTDLEKSIKRIYTEYGAIRVEQYHLPEKYTQICLVDMDYKATSVEIQALCAQDQVACTVWEQAQETLQDATGKQRTGYVIVDENVFLSPPAVVKVKVHNLQISSENPTQGFLCIPIHGGTFSLVLEGIGDATEISLPEKQ